MYAVFEDSTGGTAAKGVPEGLFDNKHVFVDSSGETPVKHVPVGLFDKVRVFNFLPSK